MEQKSRSEVYTHIKQMAKDLHPKMIATRRDFHKYAEGRWVEMRTSSLIARRLKDMGYEVLTGEKVCKRDVRMGVPNAEVLEKAYQRALAQGGDPEFLEDMKDGMTGVIGILRCGEGPVMGMRFDIDALAITETTSLDHLPVKEGFASVNPGFMHACGHDCHATFGLATAEILMSIKDQLHGTVKLVFQPCEEGVAGGAKSIVANGHFDDVMYMLGAHITEGRNKEPGIDLIPGSHGWLATGKYSVHYKGLSAHAGAYPQRGKDALLAAVTAIKDLYSIPRSGDGVTRIGVGKVFDESPVNAVSDNVRFDFEVRGGNNKCLEYMQSRAMAIVKGTAAIYDVECEITQIGEALSADSSQAMIDRVRRVCTDDLHLHVAKEDSMKGDGSEDVSYMVQKTLDNGGEASFVRLMNLGKSVAHAIDFDVNEDCFPMCASMYAGVAYDVLGK